LGIDNIHRMRLLYKRYVDDFRTMHFDDKLRASHDYLSDIFKLEIKVINNSNILADLDVEYTMDEIEHIYNEYGIIILRDPTLSALLLLGCGNNPFDEYYKGHSHANMITYDPSITMNPTVIGSLEFNTGFQRYLADRHHKYDIMALEGITVGTTKDNFFNIHSVNIFLSVLNDNYHVQDITADTLYWGRGENGVKKSNLFWNFGR